MDGNRDGENRLITEQMHHKNILMGGQNVKKFNQHRTGSQTGLMTKTVTGQRKTITTVTYYLSHLFRLYYHAFRSSVP